MPRFTEYDAPVDVEIDISVEEFFDEMDDEERREMFEFLIEDGTLSAVSRTKISAAENEFETALTKLHGKWNLLSSEEEQIIFKIAKRF